MLKREDIRVRDPYIVAADGYYYLYATSGERTMSYYRSRDLQAWEAGGVAFTIPQDSWATCDVWASEVHLYEGKYYLFVSLLGKNGLRGTQVAVCDRPTGPFVPVVNRPITPAGQGCIDATLFVWQGEPYIIYSHDWPDHYVPEKGAYVGEIWAAQVDRTLTDIVGEPFLLFASDESPISRATPHRTTWEGKPIVRYGSDAPFVQTLADGRLLLTWSPYLHDNYVVLPVISESGDIHGPWTHLDVPLYSQNGGHAMFFRDFSGQLLMCLHAPEQPPLERAHIFRMGEQDGMLTILQEIAMT